MEHHLFFNSARWFEKKGYTTFRFNLYDWQPGTRKLKECTIKTHATDIDTVLDYFKNKGVKKIHLIGHSYGGPSILTTKNRDIQNVTLWDPTALPTFKPYGAEQNRFDNSYILPGAYEVLVSEKMFLENEKLNTPSLLEKYTVPTKILCAEKSPLTPIWTNVFKTHANKDHGFSTIKGATHCFDEDGTEEKLFQETYRWIKKYE